MCATLKLAVYLYLAFSIPSLCYLQGAGSSILSNFSPLNNFDTKQIALIFTERGAI